MEPLQDRSYQRLSIFAGIAMSLGVMNDPFASFVEEVSKAETQASRKLWTCKKCNQKFHPHLGPTLCDDCIQERDRR